MITTNTYCHILNGRIRIKLAGVKRSPVKARQVEQALLKLHGVNQVQANPRTGNVLILFDSDQITAKRILSALNQPAFNPLRKKKAPSKVSGALALLDEKTISPLHFTQ